MRQILSLLAVLFIFTSYGQLKSKIANTHFERMEYSLCVKMYDEMATKFLKSKTGPESNWEYVRRAAFSHFQLFEMPQSCTYYKHLKEANRLNEKDRENYIQALRFTENYTESQALILESKSLFSTNKFFTRMQEGSNSFNKLFEDSALYTIKDAGINSGDGDFAANFSEKGIIYASKSVNTKAIHPTYGWDNDYYINLLQATYINDTTLGKGQLLKHQYLSKAHDGPVSFNSKGNLMLITKNTLGKKVDKNVVVLSLYFSKLVKGEWSDLIPFIYNNKDYNVGHAVFAEQDSAIYFVSDKPGGYGEADLYVSRLTRNNEWSEPVNLGPTINTEQNELFPFVLDNTLYFTSNGHYGLGGLDIFEQQLNSGIKPKNIGYPVNSSHDDFGYIVDTTELRGYFSSNRTDNIDRIYSFKKRPIQVNLVGIVYAIYKEKEAIPGHELTVLNETTGLLNTLQTNEFGQFSLILNTNENYRVSTSKEDFVLLQEGFVVTDGIHSDSTFYRELPLKPTTLQVRLRVVELGSGKPIAYAKTTVTDYNLNTESVLTTDENGIVVIKVDRDKTYWAHGSKKGYIDDNVAFNSANEYDKIIDLELKLPPIVKGEKFKLENIFYDLNKSTLRGESMLALDKLADFIIKNDLRIELSAHTDARGSDSYNLKLSQARAQSCVNYLITKGVKKTSIIAKGYGETQLINKCKNNVTCPEELHQDNRRTEVKIL